MPIFLSFLPSFFPSFFFLSLLSFFPPFFLPFFFSSMENVSFFPQPLGGGEIYYTELKVPKNLFTFLFLPAFFLSFPLSSPPSSFLSLLSFFHSSLLPFFFSVDKKCVIFSPAPDLNLYFWGGGGGSGVIYYMKLEVLKNTFTFLFLLPFFASFFLPLLPPFFSSSLFSLLPPAFLLFILFC